MNINVKIERKTNETLMGVFIIYDNVYQWRLLGKNKLVIIFTDDLVNININYAIEYLIKELGLENRKISVFWEYTYIDYVKYYKRFPLNYSILDYLIDSFYKSKFMILVNLIKNSPEFRNYLLQDLKETKMFKLFEKNLKYSFNYLKK